jgi:hypothetical protein
MTFHYIKGDISMRKTIIEQVNAGVYDSLFLKYLVLGYSYKEIKNIMNNTEYINRKIIQHLYSKFGAVNNVSLAYNAVKGGYLGSTDL